VYKDLQYRKKSSSNNNKFIFDNKHFSLKSNFVKDSHPSEHANTVPPTAPPLTYAKVASNQSSHPNSTPPTQDTSPSAETNLSHLMSSFLNDLKTLINPLISLLTTVISSLLDKSK